MPELPPLSSTMAIGAAFQSPRPEGTADVDIPAWRTIVLTQRAKLEALLDRQVHDKGINAWPLVHRLPIVKILVNLVKPSASIEV